LGKWDERGFMQKIEDRREEREAKRELGECREMGGA